jgi:ATP-dependent Clp protease ATP-binding subunit ClpA
MLYGPSGVGKTETAKSISRTLGGNLLRVQFSMMQTTEAYNYVFGSEHSKNSFARDMMARESNVILIDEFDKVNPIFYNAFYELFDEGKFVDSNYEVSLKNAIFLCTCNFMSENEIMKSLGPSMFSRIGYFIEYDDISIEQKQKIIGKWYLEILERLKTEERKHIENTDIREWFMKNSNRYNNIRILKTKLENAIFDELTDSFIIKATDNNVHYF